MDLVLFLMVNLLLFIANEERDRKDKLGIVNVRLTRSSKTTSRAKYRS